MMQLRQSSIIRLFAVLLVLLLTLLILAGTGIYTYATHVVGEEFLRLNQASLRQVAGATGRTLSEVRIFGERVTVNSGLLRLTGRSDEEAHKEARTILNKLMTEYASLSESLSLLETVVVGEGGLHAASYNTGSFTLEQLLADPRLEPLLAGEREMELLSTSRDSGGRGVMIYTFQMVFPMENLISGEGQGLVVLNLSELLLYKQYSAFQKGDVMLMVVDEEGNIVSTKDKGRIGTYCGYAPSELEGLTQSKRVEERIVDGNFLLCERIPGTEWFLVERMSTAAAFAPLTQVRNMILAVTVVCGVLAMAAMALSAHRMFRRVMCIKNRMEQVIGGDLETRIPVEREDEFGSIEASFNTMVAEIQRLIQQVRQGERQKRMAELDFLQAQINPHFIHNTLTSIRFMLEMGRQQEAGEMIFYFSKLLRQTLSRSDEFIQLGEELNTLENYVNLQKFRYRDTFEVSYDIQPDTRESRVPALILQPVVENAIFHGVGRSLLHIRITARKEGDRLLLTVEDDGVGMSKELRETVLHKDVQVNRVGLRNVHDRIQLNYGKEYGLSVAEREGRGTVIVFTLPFVGPGGEEEGRG